MPPTILLIGLGGLGAVILELLVREDVAARVIVASRNEVRGVARCNLARLGALAQGRAAAVDFVRMDLDAEDETADTIRRLLPDVILCTATRLTWWMPERLPEPHAARLRRAGFGVWLPVHLILPLKLMRALQKAEFTGFALTAPFPDVVNCVLGRLGLAPTCGVGNLDEIVPKLGLLAADRLGVPTAEIRITLVAHHALESVAFGEPVGEPVDERPPFFLRIEHGHRDVTFELRGDELLTKPYPLPAGPPTHFLTAGSAIRLVRALLSDELARLHAPGPIGLPGGYPILADRTGVRVPPIDGLPLAEAIAINERSHRFDGIERIEEDGTVVFMEAAAGALRQDLGYACRRLSPADVDGRADELLARFGEFMKRHGLVT